MKAKLLFASLLELVKRKTEFKKSKQVIFNGLENDYPERVERLIENSITAKSAAKLFRQYIIGKGFGDDLNGVIVNKELNKTLFDFLKDLGRSYSKHGGAFVHVKFALGGYPVSFNVLDYTQVRKGKKDSKNYNGKFALYDDWTKGVKQGEVVWLNSYNTKKGVIQDQIQKAGDIKKYRGQIFFYNPSNYDYPLAHINPVLNDADSEFRAGVFKNKSLRKGFFGKKIIVMPPSVDEDYELPDNQLTKEQVERKKYQERQREDNHDVIKGFVGVDNHEGVMLLEMEFEGDDIDKVIKVVDVETDIDDELFAHTETSCANNIRKAYSNIPPILIDSNDNTFFGNSGEALVKAREFYQEQTEEDRSDLSEVVRMLFKDFPPLRGKELTIEPLIKMSVDVISG